MARLRASSLDAFTAYISSSPAVLASLPVVNRKTEAAAGVYGFALLLLCFCPAVHCFALCLALICSAVLCFTLIVLPCSACFTLRCSVCSALLQVTEDIDSSWLYGFAPASLCFTLLYTASLCFTLRHSDLLQVTEDIGNSWLYGTPADPIKLSVFREARRYTLQHIAAG